MVQRPIALTLVDREVLNSYSQFVDGLGAYLGNAYEIVLHSLETYEHSVINILHGEHTGRKVGAPITDLALNMLEQFSDTSQDHITYFSTNKRGEPLKSTTIAIRGEQNRIIGLLCINFYMNTPLKDLLTTLIPEPPHPFTEGKRENYVDNSEELIASALEDVRSQVLADDSITSSNKNKYIVYRLDDCGIFNIKDAVVKVASLLNISKNTVYMHLRNRSRSEDPHN